MRKEEQQVGWGELKDCSVCGSPLLKDVDFDGNTPTQLICANCRNLDTRDKSIINASIIEQQQQEEAYYTSDGIAKHSYYYDKIIPDNDINRQRDIEAINAALTKTVTTNVKVDVNQNIKKVKREKIIIDWSKIIGYEPIKFAITQTLNSKSKKKTHMLIVGAAGTSKTVFLNVIEENLKKQNLNVHYLDATTLTSSGVIQYLFDNDIEFALIDEIDKLEKEHQRTFLNLLESGLLQETKFKRIRRKEMKNTIFIATGNYIEKIMHPLLTRFMTFKIPEYTKEEFHTIGVQLLSQQYDKTPDIAYYIVSQIWNIYTEIRHEKPNLRYARDVANLSDNDKSTIDPLLEAQKKYSQNYEE